MFSSTLLVWWFLKFMNRRTGQGTSVSTMALFAAWPPAPACWSRAQERGDPSGSAMNV